MSEMVVDGVNLLGVNVTQEIVRIAGSLIRIASPVGPHDVVQYDQINLGYRRNSELIHTGFDGQTGKLSGILLTIRTLFGQSGKTGAIRILLDHGRPCAVPGIFVKP
jgi:hypothetical protein